MLFRHAKPTVISVNLRCNLPNLVLEITDNGSGIADSQAASREGLGFSNLRARTENIGAQLEVRSAAGRGTTIKIRVRISSLVHLEVIHWSPCCNLSRLNSGGTTFTLRCYFGNNAKMARAVTLHDIRRLWKKGLVCT